MPCYSPLNGFIPVAGGKLLSVERGDCRPVEIPCGRCIGCRLMSAQSWATRIVHESKMHDANCFVTLTLDDANVSRSLDYTLFQSFMRRLRKKSKRAIRFYMSGEYGSQTWRPHFHAILFGIDFSSDRVYYRKSPAGNRLYKSAFLDEVWSHGLCSIGAVTHESAAYCASYVLKKVSDNEDRLRRVDPETGEVYCLRPEFSRMSLRPGIGESFFKAFKDELLNWDQAVISGKKRRLPRYYDRLAKRALDTRVDANGYDRYVRATSPERLADCTPERLAVSEEVCRARLKFKTRDLE